MFKYELSHRLYVGTSKAIKAFFMTYLSSPFFTMKWMEKWKNWKPFRTLRVACFLAYNSHLYEIQNQLGAPGLHFNILIIEKSQQLNGFFVRNTIRTMLPAKYYNILDIYIDFVAVIYQ